MPKVAFFLLFACLPLLVGCDPHSFFFEQPITDLGGDYLEVRDDFTTNLTYRGPSPQEWDEEKPDKNVWAVRYPSGNLMLKAWVYVPGNDANRRRPALIFCHGGFACDSNEVMAPEAFIKGGYVVMAPTWRGENGNPGDFEMMFGEVDDAVNAARWLAKQSYVDPNNIYMFGHSVGGGISALVSLMDDVPVRHTGSSGGLYPATIFRGWSDITPFDYNDRKECALRILDGNTGSMRRKHYAYLGRGDYNGIFGFAAKKYVTGKVEAPQLVIDVIPGNHFTSFDGAVTRYFETVEKDRKSTSTEPSTPPQQSVPTEPIASPEPIAAPEPNTSPEQNTSPGPDVPPEPSVSPRPFTPPEPIAPSGPNIPPRSFGPPRSFAPPRPFTPPEPSVPHRPFVPPRPSAPLMPGTPSRETAENSDASATYDLTATYVDPRYGFRFKRDPRWIRQDRNGPCFCATDRTGAVEAGFMVLTQPRNPRLMTMTQREAEQEAKKFGNNAKILDFKKTKFKEIDCIYLRTSVVSGKAGRCIFINHSFDYKNRGFSIAYFSVESKFEEYSPIFEAVLESFQFP